MLLPTNQAASSSPYYPSWSLVPFGILAVTYTLGQHAWIALSRRIWNRGGGNVKNTQHSPWLSLSDVATRNSNNHRHKVAIVTGSNTGIGYETAKALVVDYGMTVILACRSRDKAERAAQQINLMAAQENKHQSQTDTTNTAPTTPGKAIFLHPLDLSSFESVQEFSRHVKQQFSRIHVLVNNAGRNTSGESVQAISSSKGGTTTSGAPDQPQTLLSLDLLFQSNFLGHFLLTSELLPLLLPKGDSNDSKTGSTASNDDDMGRVINLASVMHHYCGGPRYDLERVDFWKRCATYKQSPTDTYSLSKLASILFTAELNRRFYDSSEESQEKKTPGRRRFRSVAVNPGAVSSDIWRTFPQLIQRLQSCLYLNNEQGCQTTVTAALHPFIHQDPNILYLQPYPLTVGSWDTTAAAATTKPAFPPLEMLGPFRGKGNARITAPRLPKPDGGRAAAQAVWQACSELTGATWSV